MKQLQNFDFTTITVLEADGEEKTLTNEQLKQFAYNIVNSNILFVYENETFKDDKDNPFGFETIRDIVKPKNSTVEVVNVILDLFDIEITNIK